MGEEGKGGVLISTSELGGFICRHQSGLILCLDVMGYPLNQSELVGQCQLHIPILLLPQFS